VLVVVGVTCDVGLTVSLLAHAPSLPSCREGSTARG
jgi:hypothetical protein